MYQLRFIIFLSFFVIVICTKTENKERTLNIDAVLKVPAIIRKYGYPSEIHTVQTEDGYILEMHRIPNGLAPNAGPGKKKIPVLLQHGLMSSSADYILAGPNRSLSYVLADMGFDVWMGNARGTKYSRQHVILSPKKQKFWDFSWHEIGVYDVPAMIDYILEETKEEQLFYIGHSQGTTTFYVMCSERPEYNKKIRAMMSLAPAAYVGHVKRPLLQFLAHYSKQIYIVFKLLGIHEFLPNSKFVSKFGGELCAKDNPLNFICYKMFNIIFGTTSDHINKELMEVMVGHTPAGCSTKQPIHYAQNYLQGDKFRKYDFGQLTNLWKYGNKTPPSYNLSQITAPVAIWYADDDMLIDEQDVFKLYQELPNPIGLHLISTQYFGHGGFLYGKKVVDLVYKNIINLMNQF